MLSGRAAGLSASLRATLATTLPSRTIPPSVGRQLATSSSLTNLLALGGLGVSTKLPLLMRSVMSSFSSYSRSTRNSRSTKIASWSLPVKALRANTCRTAHVPFSITTTARAARILNSISTILFYRTLSWILLPNVFSNTSLAGLLAYTTTSRLIRLKCCVVIVKKRLVLDLTRPVRPRPAKIF